jgi:hypothetical protein
LKLPKWTQIGLATVTVIAILGIYFFAQRSKLIDYGAKTQSLAMALTEGEVSEVKRFLPAGTAKSYGMSEAQLDQLIGAYLIPTYKSGNPKIGKSSSANFIQKGSTYITFQFPKRQPYLSPLEVVTNDHGYTVGLETLVNLAWGIRAEAQGLPRTEASLLVLARQDRALLEQYGMKGMADSLDTGKFYDWDEIMKRMELRMARLQEMQQKQKTTP